MWEASSGYLGTPQPNFTVYYDVERPNCNFIDDPDGLRQELRIRHCNSPNKKRKFTPQANTSSSDWVLDSITVMEIVE